MPSDYPGHDWDPNNLRYTLEETALYFCNKWPQRNEMSAAERAECYYFHQRCIADRTPRTTADGYIPRSLAIIPNKHAAGRLSHASRGDASGTRPVEQAVPPTSDAGLTPIMQRGEFNHAAGGLTSGDGLTIPASTWLPSPPEDTVSDESSDVEMDELWLLGVLVKCRLAVQARN